MTRFDGMRAEERKAWQSHALKHFLRRHVAPFSPFYREHFRRSGFDPASIRSLDDLRRLPFISKADLLPTEARPNAPRDFVLAPEKGSLGPAMPFMEKVSLAAEACITGFDAVHKGIQSEYNPESLFVTTGRSAGSVPVFLTRHDRARLLEAGRRICGRLDLEPVRDRTLSLFPYAPHLAFWQVAACGEGANVLTFNSGGGRIIPTSKLLDLVETFQPTCVSGMPGFVGHLLRAAVHEGRAWRSVRMLTLGGENVPAGLSEKLVAMLAEVGAQKAVVRSVFGFTEARVCSTECLHGRHGFHTNPDMEIYEVVHPESGEPVAEGQSGELVYTCLDGRGSVLLRYRTGDLVEGGVIESEPCPGCGSRVPRITSAISRVSNMKELALTKVKGTLVDLNRVADLISGDPDVREWQLVVRKKGDQALDVDEMIVSIALKTDAIQDTVRARLQTAVFAATECHFNDIEVIPLSELMTRLGTESRPKEDRLVDRRHLAR